MRIFKLLAAVLPSAPGASLLLLLPTLLLSSRIASAATATASIGVTILGRADVAVAAGAVSVAGLRPIELGDFRPAAATAHLEGARNATFSVTVPNEVQASERGREITVRPYASGAGSPGRLSPNGSTELEIGARIDPSRAPAPGQYTGSFPVTIAYN